MVGPPKKGVFFGGFPHLLNVLLQEIIAPSCIYSSAPACLDYFFLVHQLFGIKLDIVPVEAYSSPECTHRIRIPRGQKVRSGFFFGRSDPDESLDSNAFNI